MATTNLLATAKVSIAQSPAKVWKALTDPQQIKEYMFGTNVTSDWQKGSEITWEGEMKGKKYKDKGKILDTIPNEKLSYTHYSPLAGKPDTPDSYHTVTIRLAGNGDMTDVTLTQDNNQSAEAAKESTKNWEAMLQGLKKVVEGK